MNWYIVVSVVAAFLLGWAIGISFGAAKGYAAAQQEYEQLKTKEMWSNYFNQFKGGEDEQE
jgi:hypothetical protein